MRIKKLHLLVALALLVVIAAGCAGTYVGFGVSVPGPYYGPYGGPPVYMGPPSYYY
jgi:hypothetical protein